MEDIPFLLPFADRTQQSSPARSIARVQPEKLLQPALKISDIVQEAMRFPIMGSVSLLSLFMAIKFLPKGWVNIVIGIYFCIMGVFAVGGARPLISLVDSTSSALSLQACILCMLLVGQPVPNSVSCSGLEFERCDCIAATGGRVRPRTAHWCLGVSGDTVTARVFGDSMLQAPLDSGSS